MKRFILIFTFILSFQSFAWNISEQWSRDGDQLLQIQCSPEDVQCLAFCGNNSSQCVEEVPYCKNCIGGDLYVWQIFSNVGDRYSHLNVEVDSLEFFKFVQTGRYALFNARSIYNLLTSFDQLSLRKKFQKLCIGDIYPQIWFELDSTHRLGSLKYIVCQNETETNIYRGEILWNVYGK